MWRTFKRPSVVPFQRPVTLSEAIDVCPLKESPTFLQFAPRKLEHCQIECGDVCSVSPMSSPVRQTERQAKRYAGGNKFFTCSNRSVTPIVFAQCVK